MESQNFREPSQEELKYIVPKIKHIINEMNYFRNDDHMYLFWRNVFNTFKATNRLNRIPHLADL